VVDEGILTVTIIHLAGLRSNLIELSPCMLSGFTMKMTSVGGVCRRVAVCTVILVILHMDEWDKIASGGHGWHQVDEVFFKSFRGIHMI